MDGIAFLAVITILFTLIGLAATAFGVDLRPDFDGTTRVA